MKTYCTSHQCDDTSTTGELVRGDNRKRGRRQAWKWQRV